MLIASIQLELFIHDSQSLKEKRAVIKSLKDQIRNKFNVSVAEVAELDKWQRAVIGIASVSNERQQLDKIHSKILNIVEREMRVELIKNIYEVV